MVRIKNHTNGFEREKKPWTIQRFYFRSPSVRSKIEKTKRLTRETSSKLFCEQQSQSISYQNTHKSKPPCLRTVSN